MYNPGYCIANIKNRTVLPEFQGVLMIFTYNYFMFTYMFIYFIFPDL